MKKLLFVFGICSLVVMSCTKEHSEVFRGDYTVEDYKILEEAGLILPESMHDYGSTTFAGNDQKLVTLGRVLFFDKNISDAGEISCASCHQQQLAFADDVALSIGVRGQATSRNSMALGQFQNFQQYYSSGNPIPLFWDGRQSSFHDQMMETMANPVEMDIDFDKMLDRIENLEYYEVLSRIAFPNVEKLTANHVTDAMDAFMKTFLNKESKYDLNKAGYTDSESRGYALFEDAGCEGCHQLETTNRVEFANNGLDLIPTDVGLYNSTFQASDRGLFKTPKLRNIEVTGPYMHDGRFETLEEVIDFYSDGIQNSPNLHNDLVENGLPKKFNFSQQNKDDLIAFLKTLTDPVLLSHDKWSDPYEF